jgi:hypothetical protein
MTAEFEPKLTCARSPARLSERISLTACYVLVDYSSSAAAPLALSSIRTCPASGAVAK